MGEKLSPDAVVQFRHSQKREPFLKRMLAIGRQTPSVART